MGFSIKNEVNRVQPVAFAPVMGLDDSKLTAGQTIQRDFAIGAIAGGWNEALEYISDSIYKVKDYRKQHTASLTEAAFNMIDLVKQDAAAGWDARLKGFYDIEANPAVVPTVVHAAPLAIISAAVLSRDEEFYLTRALPTIEYTLSRSGFRWAKAVSGTPFNSDKNHYSSVRMDHSLPPTILKGCMLYWARPIPGLPPLLCPMAISVLPKGIQ